MLEHRLYVGNLADDVSIEALRKRFATCGAVSDVHLATDRASGRMRGYAFVTMATAAEARSAIDELNGSMFEHRPLRVTEAGEEREGARARKAEAASRAHITLQFRERLNMTYELDCAGVLLTIKIFPENDGEAWRIDASTRGVAGEASASETAKTRALALSEVGRVWRERNPSWSSRTLDWNAITEALTTVRAI